MIPDDLLYSKDHEWIKLDGDIAVIGITDYAQGELGDIVFVELPSVGSKAESMQPFGTIEAVKAVSDLVSPFTGEVVEINDMLENDAGIVNSDPYGDGWMIKVKVNNKDELNQLIDAAAYKELVGQS